jgi:hypothetical protein
MLGLVGFELTRSSALEVEMGPSSDCALIVIECTDRRNFPGNPCLYVRLTLVRTG